MRKTDTQNFPYFSLLLGFKRGQPFNLCKLECPCNP